MTIICLFFQLLLIYELQYLFRIAYLIHFHKWYLNKQMGMTSDDERTTISFLKLVFYPWPQLYNNYLKGIDQNHDKHKI